MVCMLTSHSAQKKGSGRQSPHRTTAGLVGRCVLPHFLVPQRCSPDGVSLPSTSLKRDFVVCSRSRKLGEDLLRLQEVMPHHLRYCSVSAGDLAENSLRK